MPARPQEAAVPGVAPLSAALELKPVPCPSFPRGSPHAALCCPPRHRGETLGRCRTTVQFERCVLTAASTAPLSVCDTALPSARSPGESLSDRRTVSFVHSRRRFARVLYVSWARAVHGSRLRTAAADWMAVCLSAVQVLLPPGHRCIAAVMDELRRLVDALLTSDAFSRRRAFGPVAHAAPAPAAVGRSDGPVCAAALRCVLAHGCGGSILASCATVRSPARSEGAFASARRTFRFQTSWDWKRLAAAAERQWRHRFPMLVERLRADIGESILDAAQQARGGIGCDTQPARSRHSS